MSGNQSRLLRLTEDCKVEIRDMIVVFCHRLVDKVIYME